MTTTTRMLMTAATVTTIELIAKLKILMIIVATTRVVAM